MALAVIDKNKNFSPMYDMLYVHYMRTKQVPEAEQILKRKVENNPQQANFLVQLAAHYLFTQQNASSTRRDVRRLDDEKQFPEGHLLAGDFLFLPGARFRRRRARSMKRAKRRFRRIR